MQATPREEFKETDFFFFKENLIELQKNKEHRNPGRSSSGADRREDALEY